jgi:hypothetical protein
VLYCMVNYLFYLHWRLSDPDKTSLSVIAVAA